MTATPAVRGSPLFRPRMVMALRALQSLSQEKLCRVLELRGRIFDLPIPRDRRIHRHVSRRSQNLAHEFVERFVFQEAVANPGVKSVRATFVRRIASPVSQ